MACISAMRCRSFTSHGRKDFTVQGLFKPVGIGEVFGGNIAVMDVYSAQVVFDRGRNFDRIDLMNAPDAPVDTVQQRLHDRFAAGIDVVRLEVRGQALGKRRDRHATRNVDHQFCRVAGGRVYHF